MMKKKMIIHTKVMMWGNSLAIRLPKDLISSLDIKPESNVEIIKTSENTFEVKKSREQKVISKEDFWKAFKKEKFEIVGEVDWGSPQGKEIW